MTNMIPLPLQRYKVYCRCFTFNQAPYIEDALNGFAIQKTSFPYACMVVDDCSTDGEQEVIKSWLEKECDMSSVKYYDDETVHVIFVPHTANTNCTFAVYLLKENLYKHKERKMSYVAPWRQRCEYEALCEGDDYWTNPNKLQKQVDFLDHHEEYTLIGCNARIETADGNFLHFFSDKSSSDITVEDIINKWTIPTASMLFRSVVMKSCPEIKNAPQGDIIMQLTCADLGKCRYESDVYCVYRWLVPGSSTSRVRNDQLNYYYRHYDMWVALNEYFSFKYDYNIKKRLVETRRKIRREKIYHNLPFLQKLRDCYRSLRGF